MESTCAVPGAVETDVRAGKYLTFQVGREEFAIRVLKVREIMRMQEVTTVPHTPAHVAGVINLRGKVVPVVDLRKKFQCAVIENGQRTCIVVVEVNGDGGRMMMGAIVDSVSEVLNVAAGDIENTPDFGEGVSTPHILGIAKSKKKVYILLDIDQVLTKQELSGLRSLEG
jgi:purine-binding chemotaxis protein CheW